MRDVGWLNRPGYSMVFAALAGEAVYAGLALGAHGGDIRWSAFLVSACGLEVERI